MSEGGEAGSPLSREPRLGPDPGPWDGDRGGFIGRGDRSRGQREPESRLRAACCPGQEQLPGHLGLGKGRQGASKGISMG